MGVLIDTCIWVDVERGALAPGDVAALTGSEPVYLSPVTIAELRFGVDACADPGVKQRRAGALRRLMRKPVLAIDAATGEVFGSLAALNLQLALTGLLIGLCTVPGAFVARALLKRIPAGIHVWVMETMVAVGAITLLWRAV